MVIPVHRETAESFNTDVYGSWTHINEDFTTWITQIHAN